MPASEPSWWYGEGPHLATSLLRPVARVYGFLAERRWRTTTPHVSRLPVICVGNFTAGGTGKTPFCQLLVRRLQAQGARPAILSRGYGGTTRGPHWVDTARDRAGSVGDEPILLATSAPVMVARDRAVGAQAIERDSRAITHIVMDDGLQNPALRKALTVAIVDGARGFGNGEVIPAGPLRARLADQLARVDAIVVNGGSDGDVAAEMTRRFPGPVLAARIAPVFDVASLAGKSVIAFAGIGVPARFFSMLAGMGVQIREAIPFPDHHAFSEADASDLLGRARANGAPLLTTEKDLARLAGLDGVLADLRASARAVPIQLVLSSADDARLDALLATCLSRRST